MGSIKKATSVDFYANCKGAMTSALRQQKYLAFQPKY